jgi:alpha-amylase
MKGSVISIMTTVGSPPKNASLAVYTPFKSDFPATEQVFNVCSTYKKRLFVFRSILSCRQWVVGSNGTVEVEYSKGGKAVILIPSSLLSHSDICADGVPSILTIGNGAPSLQVGIVACASLILSLALFLFL